MKIQYIKVSEQTGGPVVEMLLADDPVRETANEWIQFSLLMPDAPKDASLTDLQAEALRRAQKILARETKAR